MTMTQDTARYSSTAASGPTFTSQDIAAGVLAAIMILGPLTAAGTHANPQGWPSEQTMENR